MLDPGWHLQRCHCADRLAKEVRVAARLRRRALSLDGCAPGLRCCALAVTGVLLERIPERREVFQREGTGTVHGRLDDRSGQRGGRPRLTTIT